MNEAQQTSTPILESSPTLSLGSHSFPPKTHHNPPITRHPPRPTLGSILSKGGQIIVSVVAVGKRDNNAVYKIAAKRV